MAKLIKVHNDVYDGLTAIKKADETYSEVVVRLINLYLVLQRVQKEADGGSV